MKLNIRCIHKSFQVLKWSYLFSRSVSKKNMGLEISISTEIRKIVLIYDCWAYIVGVEKISKIFYASFAYVRNKAAPGANQVIKSLLYKEHQAHDKRCPIKINDINYPLWTFIYTRSSILRASIQGALGWSIQRAKRSPLSPYLSI